MVTAVVKAVDVRSDTTSTHQLSTLSRKGVVVISVVTFDESFRCSKLKFDAFRDIAAFVVSCRCSGMKTKTIDIVTVRQSIKLTSGMKRKGEGVDRLTLIYHFSTFANSSEHGTTPRNSVSHFDPDILHLIFRFMSPLILMFKSHRIGSEMI